MNKLGPLLGPLMIAMGVGHALIGLIVYHDAFMATLREGPEDQVMVITNGGQIIRTHVAQIREAGRNTQGVRIIRVGESERVVDVEPVAEPDEGEPAPLPELGDSIPPRGGGESMPPPSGPSEEPEA